MPYSDAIMDLFRRTPRAGRLAEAPGVVSGTAGTPGSRAVLRLDLQIEDDHIVDSRFQAYGGPAAIAAGAWTAEWAVNKTPDEARGLSVDALEAALRLPPVKRHCALLAQDALSAALGRSG